MIQSAFYPTDTTVLNTNIELTAPITDPSITPYQGDVASPYYMGYILHDDFPACCNIATYTVQNGLLMRKELKQNHSWGFWYNTNDGDENIVFNRIYTDNDGVRQKNSARTFRFVNSATMAKLSYEDRFAIQFNYVIVRTADIDNNGSIINKSQENANVTNTYRTFNNTPTDITRAQWADFIAGNIGFTIPSFYVGKSGTAERVQFNITVMAADLDNDDNTAIYTEGNFTCYLQINRFRPAAVCKYLTYNLSATITSIIPFIQYHIPAGDTHPEQNIIASPYRNENPFIDFMMDSTRTQIVSLVTNAYWIDNIGFGYSNADKTLSLAGFNGLAGVQDFSWSGIVNGKMIVTKANGLYSARIYQTLSLEDITKMLCLLNKIAVGKQTQGTISVSANYITENSNSYLVALFNTNNEPLYQQISGDTADLSTMLQDWQQPGANITTDDYEFDDMPEYIPDEDDDSKSSGVDYRPNTSFAIDTATGFVTQYVLTPSQLGNLGQYLWAGMFDDDFLNSIMVSFGESFSFDPANILKYIVSVRYFPFSFTGRYGFSYTNDTIFIGRGTKGIELHSGSQIGIFDSYCEDIDGGYAIIPYVREDFRDYEPCASVQVVVPFCGTVELTPSQVVGSVIKLKYCVDFSTGAIQAAVIIVNEVEYIAAILNGNIGATVELTASNLGQVLQKGAAITVGAIAGAALIAVGAGGAGAGEAMSEITALKSTEMTAEGGKQVAESISSLATIQGSAPATCSMSSGFSSFHVTEPIVKMIYRHYAVPSNYGHVHGYACNKAVTIGSLEGKGFSVFKNVDLSGIPATYDELNAIESLLQSGVYL